MTAPDPARCTCPCGCGVVIRLLRDEPPDPDGLCWSCRHAILVGTRPDLKPKPDEYRVRHVCR